MIGQIKYMEGVYVELKNVSMLQWEMWSLTMYSVMAIE